MSNRGVLCYAMKNELVDYLRLARYLAYRAKEYLDLPLTVVTDEPLRAKELGFDSYVSVGSKDAPNYRGYLEYEAIADFRNGNRYSACVLSPYEQTILLDTDYIICSDSLLKCFDAGRPILIGSDISTLFSPETSQRFSRISTNGIKMYWATAVYFDRSVLAAQFFNCVQDVKKDWSFYAARYNFSESMFRNDFAFSIAVHVKSNYIESEEFELPSYYAMAMPTDALVDIDGQTLTFKSGQNVVRTSNTDVHVMNKKSILECLQRQTTADS